jgi:hypothetical protein
VSPAAFLQALFWGGDDPNAEMLLRLALDVEALRRDAGKPGPLRTADTQTSRDEHG